jgi:hypothetical protein
MPDNYGGSHVPSNALREAAQKLINQHPDLIKTLRLLSRRMNEEAEEVDETAAMAVRIEAGKTEIAAGTLIEIGGLITNILEGKSVMRGAAHENEDEGLQLFDKRNRKIPERLSAEAKNVLANRQELRQGRSAEMATVMGRGLSITRAWYEKHRGDRDIPGNVMEMLRHIETWVELATREVANANKRTT